MKCLVDEAPANVEATDGDAGKGKSDNDTKGHSSSPYCSGTSIHMVQLFMMELHHFCLRAEFVWMSHYTVTCSDACAVCTAGLWWIALN